MPKFASGNSQCLNMKDFFSIFRPNNDKHSKVWSAPGHESGKFMKREQTAFSCGIPLWVGVGLLLFLLRGFPEPVSRKVAAPAFGIVLTTNHMAVFQITTKQLKVCNGIRIDPGLSVQIGIF